MIIAIFTGNRKILAVIFFSIMISLNVHAATLLAGEAAAVRQTQMTVRKVNSYYSRGKIIINYSEKFIEAAKGPKKKIFSYEVFSKDANMKLDVQELDDEGMQLDRLVHYLTPTNYFRLDRSGMAVITSDVTGPDQANMNDFFGPFASFSFLLQPITVYGFRPITPFTLKDSNAWKKIHTAQTVNEQTVKDKGINLSYREGDNRWEIFFIKLANSTQFAPQEIKYYSKAESKDEESLMRRLTVKKYQEGADTGMLPKNMLIECYFPTKNSPVLAASFDYFIEKIELNKLEDDEMFEFDPSLASRIWDADRKVFINVPK
jgi:hypothetical protein